MRFRGTNVPSWKSRRGNLPSETSNVKVHAAVLQKFSSLKQPVPPLLSVGTLEKIKFIREFTLITTNPKEWVKGLANKKLTTFQCSDTGQPKARQEPGFGFPWERGTP